MNQKQRQLLKEIM